VTAPENRAKGMGMIGAAFGIGFIIGPALGGMLAGSNLETANLRAPGVVACALSAVALLGVILLLKESLPQGAAERPRRGRIGALRDALGRRVLARLLAIFFLTILAFAGMESTFALWAMAQFGWGPAQTGYLFTYVGLLSAVMQGGLIGRLTTRFGEEKLLIAGLAAIAGGLLVLPLSRDLPLLLLATSALALGMGAMQPSLNSLISRRAGVGEQGEVLGVAQSVGSLSRVLGPLLAGALFAGFGRASPYFCGMALVIVATLISWRLPPVEAVTPAPAPGPAE
jgi:DHA1 family tetracycline resistance protein-like MFS transporter